MRISPLRAVRTLLALLAWAVASLGWAQPLQKVPPLSARVTDLTGTLDAGQRQQLESSLAALEKRKGTQIAILLVPTTQPEPIEQYALRVAEAWKLGRGKERAQRDTGDKRAQAIDDGLLIVVAKNDRKVRIEVGYGLEGAVPDAIAKRIISESISPRFRQGDFFGGLQAAVADLSARIAGEDLPAPWQPGHGGGADAGSDSFSALLPIVLMAFVLGTFVSRMLGRFIGAGLGGAGAGVATTALVSAGPLAMIVGAGVFLLVLMTGGGGGGGNRLRRTGPNTIGQGPVILPGGWGGGGFGGGGGGGFGGGGGGFGGGGASGDW
jgi:uncharacterized protein